MKSASPTDSWSRARTGIQIGLDRLFVRLTLAFAVGIGGILLTIVLVLGIQAWPAIHQFGGEFLLSQGWNPVEGRETYGVLPMIYGTLVSSGIALLFAVPLGLGTAIFLTEDYWPLGIRTVLIFLVELLAAIPSVVYGLWGIVVLIPVTKSVGLWLYTHLGYLPVFSTPPIGPGLLPAGLVLAIMILPIITAISRDALASLPADLRQGALGLGATRWGTVFRVLIPAAFSGIVGAIMLALGRAMGETMAVTMIIGNANQITPSLLAPANTIASLLANQFAEAKGLQIAALMYAALVLMGMTLGVNVLAQAIVDQVKAKYR